MSFNTFGEEEVPCETCGTLTTKTGTKRCDACWEVEHRLFEYLSKGGDKARRFVASVFKDQNFGAGVPGLIAEECYALRDLLISKNKAYGNAALDPVRIFSKASTEEQLRVRLDDKISRLVRGQAAGEDVELDLLGYLILLRISRKFKPETT